MIKIPYDLWPIWCDYLEEQGQDTELLRYVLTWGIFVDGFYVDVANVFETGNSRNFPENHGDGLYYAAYSNSGFFPKGSSIFEREGCDVNLRIIERKYKFRL